MFIAHCMECFATMWKAFSPDYLLLKFGWKQHTAGISRPKIMYGIFQKQENKISWAACVTFTKIIMTDLYYSKSRDWNQFKILFKYQYFFVFRRNHIYIGIVPGHLSLPIGSVLTEHSAKDHTPGFLMMLSSINSYSFGFTVCILLALETSQNEIARKSQESFLSKTI